MPITKATASSIAPAAKGDLVVGSATNDASVLAVGSANQVLTVDSSTTTGLKWAAPAAASFVGVGLTKTAAQSINNVTFTKLSWNTEDYDTSSFHDNSVNNERITIPSGKGGYYHIAGFVSFDLNSTGGRIVQLHKNGSAVNSIVSLPTTGASDFTNLPMSYVINLVATDYIELFVYQASGGALNVRSVSNWQVTYLGA